MKYKVAIMDKNFSGDALHIFVNTKQTRREMETAAINNLIGGLEGK
jgi:hypothetical protein